MRFGVLGPIEMRRDGRPLPVGSGRERFVLASLLLNADRVTSVDRLTDALWTTPPRSAKAQVHNMISNLRRRLREAGSGDPIRSHPGGYELCLGEHELDLTEFRRLLAQGRDAVARGDYPTAASSLTESLSLWRGPALADVSSELVADERRALHDEQFAAAEAALDVQLALGRYHEVLHAMPPLITKHPYRERLHETRMLALLGAGRRAEALAHYRQTYQRFIDELGVEPSAPLRELELRILRDDLPVLAQAPAPHVPRQTPVSSTTLTGRDALLDTITATLLSGDDTASPVAVVVGPGGVGKTAVALATAHRLADAFPDGQLYADLAGSQRVPADPHAVAGRFLRAVGVGGSALPDDPDERIALYRSRFAGRRALIVLDDAGGTDQVRPLLPATSGCRTLITSRHQLGALIGAARWTVPVLAPEDALELFAAVAGRDRVAAEPDAAAEIVRLCARLPLAVSIAAARLAVHPYWTLDDVCRRLAREHGRLDELSVGDLDVRASIALSYAALEPEPRQLFRRLGLVEAPTWPGWIVDALAGRPAARMLDQLVDVHLVEPTGRDVAGQCRYRLHDLVADFAAERALAEDERRDRATATGRMLAQWLAVATAADEQIPHGVVRTSDLPVPTASPSVVPLAFDSPTSWFEAERRSLVRAVDHAIGLDRPDLAGALALRASGFLYLRSYNDDWDHVLRAAITHARERGDRRLFVRLLATLFTACLRRDRHVELPAIAAEQLDVARDLGDRAEEVLALTNASRAASRLSRFGEAIEWLERAVPMAEHPDVDDALRRAALAALAANLVYTGRAVAALPLFEEALDIKRTPGSMLRVALHLYHYGVALTRAGRLSGAAAALTEARHISGDHGDSRLEAYTEQALADVDIRRGRHTAAAKRLDRARETHQRLGEGDGLAEALRSTGDLAAAEGHWTDAIAWLHRSLEVWRRIDSKIELAGTLARLERAHRAAGDTGTAASCGREYRTLLHELGLDETCLYLTSP